MAYVAVDDAGNIISPAIVEGQIMGGIAQGVGSALAERIVYDEGGQLVTSSFMDYAMPRADDFPLIKVLTLSCPLPRNRLGVKGVGEAGTTGAIPAVANAVIDALRARGVCQLDIPLTPQKIWHANFAREPDGAWEEKREVAMNEPASLAASRQSGSGDHDG